MSLRERITGLLERYALCRLAELRGEPGIFRALISLSYDRDLPLSWRAMEAVGVLCGEAAKTDPASVRSLVQRLLWMMRDESGNNAWSAPHIIGEIVRNCPDQLNDIPPIIASFHDEELLRPGVLCALVRIGEKRPDLLGPSGEIGRIIGEYLKHRDPFTRAVALRLAGIMGTGECLSAVGALLNDASLVRTYRDGELREGTVGKIAEETVILIRSRGL